MSWSKLKKNLEGYLAPNVMEQVAFGASAYKYAADKSGNNYITVNKVNVFNMNDKSTGITWYGSDQDVIKDEAIRIYVSVEEIEAVRNQMNANVPEDRLLGIATKQKRAAVAKQIFAAQTALAKSNFTAVATTYLAKSLDESLKSEDLLLNIFALLDRRLGKKRLSNLRNEMQSKHPIVQYFYELRLNA